jgi:hypothetical protein
VWGVTRSTKFPDKGSFGESSKPAGRSASEPISSLVITKKELPTLWTLGEGWDTGLNENCQNGLVGFRGSRGDTQGKSGGVARETLVGAVEGSNGRI